MNAVAARTRPRVLVIEDERRLRELLLDVVPQMGFATRAVRSAEEAKVALAGEAAEILLLDLHLPGMGGLEFLEGLRAAGTEVEVIILTAYGDLATAQKAIRNRVADFLTKPSPLGEIEAALERARRRVDERWEKAVAATEPEVGGEGVSLAESERRQILAAVARNGGNCTAAAVELGISRRTLHYRLAEYRRDGLM